MFSIFLTCGFIRADAVFSKQHAELDALLHSKEVVLEGTIVEEPNVSGTSQKMVVEVAHEGVVSRIRVIASPYPRFVYGDVLRIQGIVQKPKAFTTETGRVFDYPSYLAKEGVFYEIRYPRAERISEGGGNGFYGFLYTLRRIFIENIQAHIAEPYAALGTGISIGAQGMDTETQDIFRRVGLIHVIVLSGYNIAVVGGLVMRSLAFLPHKIMLCSGALTIVLFTLMTGASTTAVRASVMALIALAAQLLGERYDITRALSISAVGMVFVNPWLLIFDPSFQLSFLATLGLIQLAPFFERICSRLYIPHFLHTHVASTLATQVYVMPLLMWMTGQMSIISLVANTLVLPVIPFSMFLSGLVGAFGSISFIGAALSFPTTLILSYSVFVADSLSQIPFASVEVHISFFSVVCMYVVIMWFVYRKSRRLSRGGGSTSSGESGVS